MFYKIPLFFLAFFTLFNFQCFALSHFEYYTSLNIYSHIYEAKCVAKDHKDVIPAEDYEKLIFHIENGERLLSFMISKNNT